MKMNFKTNGQAAKTPSLLAIGCALLMAGCATTKGVTESYEARMSRHGVNEITLIGFGNPGVTVGDPSSLCSEHKSDPRCQSGEIDKYRTGFVRVRDLGFTAIDIPYLAKISDLPKEWGADILKVRVKKGEIAWFEGRITKGVGDPSCYNDGGFGRGSAGKGGVICPMLDYDYRKIPVLN